MRLLFAAALTLPLAACASITRGTTDQLTITTTPPGAAVKTSMNHSCQSPCTLTVGRKDEFVVTASMPGYRDATTPVKTRLAGSGAAGFAGNVLVGGVIGMGVDAATGATLEHYPSPVALVLEPHAAAPAPTPARPTRKKTTAPKPLAFKPEAAPEG
ncbi:PEGA domain-containing protein [Methylopila henanensis]|uniref:PEGA domain-containing protein n=1 Tax=Methylopila henanensis TaxID=873516 RepID=A0ABW4K5B6_9HYPH